jgi:hypothetical protein
VTVNANGIDDWSHLVTAITKALQQAVVGVTSEHLVARLKVTGTTPLAWRIRRDLDQIKAEAEVWAGITGTSWIEKIEADCRAFNAEEGSGADPLTELTRLIDHEVLSSAAFQAEIAAIARELQGQLPAELRRRLYGDDEASFKAAVGAIAQEGAADVLARLQATEEGGEARCA